MAILIAGTVAIAFLGWSIVGAILNAESGPAIPRPPVVSLSEAPSAAADLAALSSITGLRPPPGWRLVGGRELDLGGGANGRSWIFMIVSPDPAGERIAAFRALAPKSGDAVPAAALAEAMAIELGRPSLGRPLDGWSSAQWSGADGGQTSIDTLRTEQSSLARVVHRAAAPAGGAD